MLRFNEKQISRFLFATQGVGAVFVVIFSAAYLAGLPTTAVLHSEPAFRIPLFIFGSLLLVLVLVTVLLAVFSKKD
jgi:hypothetical protein